MKFNTYIKYATALMLTTTSLTYYEISQANVEDDQNAFGNNFTHHQFFLFVNKTPVGQINADRSQAGLTKVKVPDLKRLLSGYLASDQALLMATFDNKPILLKQLRDQGFPVVFDRKTQTIRVTVLKPAIPENLIFKTLSRAQATPNSSVNSETSEAAKTTPSIPISLYSPENISSDSSRALDLKWPVKPAERKTSTAPADKATPAPGKDSARPRKNKSIVLPELQTAQISDRNEADDIAVVEEDFFPLEVPLIVNRTYIGDLTAEATLSGIAKIDAGRLLELLTSRISPEKSDILAAYGDTYVLLDKLNTQGFLIVYDPAELSVKLTLAKEGVSVMSLSGRSIDNIDFNTFEKEANFSAGTSIIMRPRYIHESQFGDTGFAPLSANLRGFFAAGGFNSWAFVYELDALEGRDRTVRRGDFTLIKDNFRKALRFQAGDIRPSISGFQNGFDVFGLSLERNYGAIQPFRNLRPGGRTQFSLERAARVNFEVNGVVTTSEFLEPGDYDISDFPLLTGANDVRIIVNDEFGTREVGSYSTFVDSNLLSSGTTLFGANLGVIREGGSSGFGPNYGDDLLGTAFYETGISDKLTLGVQTEVNADGGYIGGKAVHSRGQNIFAVETGLSSFKNFDPGYAVALQYRYRPDRDRTKTTHDIAAQFLHQTDSFQTIGSRGNPRGKVWQVSVSDSIRKDNYSINLNGSWRRDKSDDTTTLSPSISVPLDGVSFSFGYQGVYRKKTADLDNRFFITLSKNLGAAGTVRSRTRTGPWESELEWQRLSNREVGAWSGRAGYLVSEIEDELSLDATYIASRAEFDISHNSVLESKFGNTKSSVTDARLGVGLGFADGTLAFGRPVSDGFIIVKGHPSLKGRKIDTTQSSGRLEAVRDQFGPALVPLNSPYTKKIHHVIVQDLPAGFDIGSDQIKVFPSQNSGYKVLIGTDPTALVIGRLHDARDEAVSLSVGKLVPVANSDAASIDFFTNRTGRFVAERVPPGRYTLVMMPNETVITELDINEGEEGVVQLGTITMKETKP